MCKCTGATRHIYNRLFVVCPLPGTIKTYSTTPTTINSQALTLRLVSNSCIANINRFFVSNRPVCTFVGSKPRLFFGYSLSAVAEGGFFCSCFFFLLKSVMSRSFFGLQQVISIVLLMCSFCKLAQRLPPYECSALKKLIKKKHQAAVAVCIIPLKSLLGCTCKR